MTKQRIWASLSWKQRSTRRMCDCFACGPYASTVRPPGMSRPGTIGAIYTQTLSSTSTTGDDPITQPHGSEIGTGRTMVTRIVRLNHIEKATSCASWAYSGKRK
jgi:hypothetical protein